MNVLAGLQGVNLNLENLSTLGVKRVSVGSALSRAALGAFLRAATEMREKGTFAFAEEAVSYRELSAMFPGIARGLLTVSLRYAKIEDYTARILLGEMSSPHH